MSWAEIRKAVNNGFSTPLNELIAYYDENFVGVSNTIQATPLATEVSSAVSGLSTVAANWTATKTGAVKIKYRIKGVSTANAAFWCTKTSTAEQRTTAFTNVNTLFYKGFGFPDGLGLPTVYTVYETNIMVAAGTTYYFHVAGTNAQTAGAVNRIDVMFDEGAYMLSPKIKRENLLAGTGVDLILAGSGTSNATYTGSGTITLQSSNAAYTYTLYLDDDPAVKTISVPAYGGSVAIPFKQRVTVKGSAAGCSWIVITE
jgi:hypothetical protein